MTDQYGERGPWHSGDEKPEIDGVYERKWTDDEIVATKWTDGSWSFSYGFNEDGIMMASAAEGATYKQKLPWRGLANKP